jgi:hypothetical protein
MGTSRSTTPNDFPLWETQVIEDLGGRPTTAKLEVLNWWQRAEGLPAAAHNPLAIEENYAGEWGPTGTDPLIKNDVVSPGRWNSQGVVTYATDQQGAAATADFIAHGHPGVAAVLTAPNPTPQDIVKAITKDGAWSGDNQTLLSDAHLSQKGYLTAVYTGGGATGTAEGIMCSGKGDILDIPSIPLVFGSTPKINVFTYCNLKAISGGLSVGLGMVVLLVGVNVLVASAVKRSDVKGVGAATRAGLGQVNGVASSVSKAINPLRLLKS